MDDGTGPIRLTDEQRLDWLQLIRSQNVGPRGIMAQIRRIMTDRYGKFTRAGTIAETTVGGE